MVKVCPVCGTSFSTDHDKQRCCSRACSDASRPRRSLGDRFWAFVAKGDGCWLWTGAINLGNGYGTFGLDRETMRGAHRVAWELTNGPISDGLYVMHRCDNRRCVRPDHLELGTHADNMADMAAKGRGAKEQPGQRGELSTNAKLTADQVLAIRASDDRHTALAARYGVSDTLIRQIRQGKAWRWLAA